MREFRAAVAAADGTETDDRRLGLDEGEALLRTVFTSVNRHDFVGKLLAPPEAVAAYARSAPRGPNSESLVAGVLSYLFPHDTGTSPITTHSGILICS